MIVIITSCYFSKRNTITTYIPLQIIQQQSYINNTLATFFTFSIYIIKLQLKKLFGKMASPNISKKKNQTMIWRKNWIRSSLLMHFRMNTLLIRGVQIRLIKYQQILLLLQPIGLVPRRHGMTNQWRQQNMNSLLSIVPMIL